MNVCVLLPTLNEAGSVAGLIARIRRMEPDSRIVVVDSGSTDGTPAIAKHAGAELVELRERGKGLAIRKAFEEIDADRLVLLDSDGSYAPEEIPGMLAALDKCPVAVGNRFCGKMKPGAMDPLNAFGNRMLTLLANLLYGKRIHDVCSGSWAFRRDAYKAMAIDARGFDVEANFYTECARKRIAICEVPVSYGKREGTSKLNVLDGFRIGVYLIRERLR